MKSKRMQGESMRLAANGKAELKRIERDDGEYYIENNLECLGGVSGNGFLLRRCKQSVTSPQGWECIGAFFRDGSKWLAKIDVPADPQRIEDYEVIGLFDDRSSAIDALWKRRHDALCRHDDVPSVVTRSARNIA